MNRKYLGLENAWNRCTWCKSLWRFCRNNTYSLLLGILIIVSIIFGYLFWWYISDFVGFLYEDIKSQIDGVTIGSPAFRNVSLSIAGSITLSIAVLGLILTVIRNLLTRQQNRTDEQRLVTEQISRAVEQIGEYKQTANGNMLGPNIEVRLGGLYSLQSIAQDNSNDEESIVKIFYAYLRENTKKDKIKIETGIIKTQPREDVQAVLDIIGQFNKMWKEQNKEIPRDIRLNLTDANFAGYFFTDINFSGAILKDADLSDVQMIDANLSGADLFNANLENANLGNVNLSGANLFLTNLTNADLSKAEKLTKNQIEQAVGSIVDDKETLLPDDLAPPIHWIESDEEDGEDVF